MRRRPPIAAAAMASLVGPRELGGPGICAAPVTDTPGAVLNLLDPLLYAGKPYPAYRCSAPPRSALSPCSAAVAALPPDAGLPEHHFQPHLGVLLDMRHRLSSRSTGPPDHAPRRRESPLRRNSCATYWHCPLLPCRRSWAWPRRYSARTVRGLGEFASHGGRPKPLSGGFGRRYQSSHMAPARTPI